MTSKATGSSETAITATMANSMLLRKNSISPRKWPSVVTPTAHSSAAEHVVGDERAVPHLADAGDDRGERAHDRHEPGEHDRLRAVLLEERVGLGDVLLLEQARVRPAEQRGPTLPAEPVADLVAEHRGDEQADEHDRQRGQVLGELVEGRARSSAADEVRKPAKNSSESPGRKKPISSPDSAKMIAVTTQMAPRPAFSNQNSGLRKLEPNTRNPREHPATLSPTAEKPRPGAQSTAILPLR